jgi:hypothetical protein
MRKMIRPILSAMGACIFLSCYSIPNVKVGSRFSPQAKTGFLMFVVNIDGDPAGLIFRATAIRRIIPGVGEWHNLKPGKNYIFIKTAPGSYRHDAVLDRSLNRVFTDFMLEGFAFTVESGVVTYGGELVLELVESRNKHGSRVMNFRYAYRDAYPEALEYLRTNYPEILNTAALRNDCPKIPEQYYRPFISAGE